MPHDSRIIPSIEQLRQRDTVKNLENRYGREATVQALRDEATALRNKLTESTVKIADAETAGTYITERLNQKLSQSLAPSLRPVINATGVIVHTNLGRAPLGTEAVAQVTALVDGYCNLEYDLETGNRGSRTVHAAHLLSRLTGADAAAVVNNNAAAILLVIAALAYGREVIVSRGEMIEIGGGFRIPDVLKQSGAVLREVGTTNKTKASDYAAAINEQTAIILRVHPSNFTIEGFTERPSLTELTSVGARYKIPVVEDLGSGCLTAASCIAAEPTVRNSIDAGVSICTFSADKLLGGPQAGLIVGRADFLASICKHPLMRALRVGKLTYAALEATLIEHAAGRAQQTIPVSRIIALPLSELETRAKTLKERLASTPYLKVNIAETKAIIGGGSTPGLTLPSRALMVNFTKCPVAAFARALRSNRPPIVGRIDTNRLVLDLRTVDPRHDDQLAEAVSRVVNVLLCEPDDTTAD